MTAFGTTSRFALLMGVAIIAGSSALAQQREPAPPMRSQQRPDSQMDQRSAPPTQRQRDSTPSREMGQAEQHSSSVSVSAEFRTALTPHGRWEQHARFGEVWIPANRSREWRPYTVGRWVYTADWGWYWAEDREEADWGWVTYHYGRWVFDSDVGWVWVPGDEWGPAFVQWRHSADYVGWAPLPPAQIVVEYRDEPDVWVFVRSRDFVAAPRLARVILPSREYSVYLQQTIVVNQTVILDRRGFAVNPGIPAAVIAADIGRPIRTFDVRPRIFAGTVQIPGAIQVRAQDLRNRNLRATTIVRETRNTVQPTRDGARQLQPLGANEQGRLGDNPPRAAQRIGQPRQEGRQQGTPQQDQEVQQQGQQRREQQQEGRDGREPASTPGSTADERRQQGQQGRQGQQQKKEQPRQQQGRSKQERPETQGRGSDEERPQGRQGQQKKEQPRQQQGRSKQEPAESQGRGVDEQEQGRQGRSQQGQGVQRQERELGTQGRSSDEQQQRRPQPGREGRASDREQRPQGREQQRRQEQQSRPESTEGRGGNAPSQAVPSQGGQGPATEGRGGRGGTAPQPPSRGDQGENPANR